MITNAPKHNRELRGVFLDCDSSVAAGNFLELLDQVRRARETKDPLNLVTRGIQNYQGGKSFNSEPGSQAGTLRLSVLKDSHENQAPRELDKILIGIDLTGHSSALRSPAGRNVQQDIFLLLGRPLQSVIEVLDPCDLGCSDPRPQEHE